MKAYLYAFFALSIVSIVGCGPAFLADVSLINANIAQFEGDSLFYVQGNIAIRDGKVLRIDQGKGESTICSAMDTIDLQGAYVYPGFIDAHAHFLGQGLGMNAVNLWEAKNWEECVARVALFIQEHPEQAVIRGRGWDQNDWPGAEYPTNEALQGLTDKPIVLSRIDGHAVVANHVALELSGLYQYEGQPEGGEILRNQEGLPSGVLIDNAEGLLQVAQPSKEEKIKALTDAQAWCYSLGLTGVHDAGLPTEDIQLIEQLQSRGTITIPLNVMVSESPEALDEWLARGPLKTDLLTVQSFKFYSDGALGSRGALLRSPYQDRHHHYGLQIRSYAYMEEAAARLAKNGWQMNTHAIGDSANHLMLDIYTAHAPESSRWRIEHAQIVSVADQRRFGGNAMILPSVQPTHATSDMDWADDRLGEERMPEAYAYAALRKAANGILPLGTDFPVEEVNPLYTLYAASARKALDGHPAAGFQMQDAITRSQALKGMTMDAAYAAFQEEELGEVKSDFWANFTIFTEDLLTCDENKIPELKVLQTWVHGTCVYSSSNR